MSKTEKKKDGKWHTYLTWEKNLNLYIREKYVTNSITHKIEYIMSFNL